VSIRERTYHLSIYYRCFVGSEAAAWIAEDQQCYVDQAVEIGNELVNLKFIHHVTHEHLFCNGYFFYRFDAAVLEGHEEMLELEHTHSSLHPPSPRPQTPPAADDLPFVGDAEGGVPVLGRERSSGARAGSSGSRALAELREDVRALSQEVAGALFTAEALRYDLSGVTSDLQQLQTAHAAMQGQLVAAKESLRKGEVRARWLQATLVALAGGAAVASASRLTMDLQLWQTLLLCAAAVVLADRLVGVCSPQTPARPGTSESLLSGQECFHSQRRQEHGNCAVSAASSNTTSGDFSSASVAEVSQALLSHRGPVPLPAEHYHQEAVSPALTGGAGAMGGDGSQQQEKKKEEEEEEEEGHHFADIPRDRQLWPNFPLLARRGPDMLPARLRRGEGSEEQRKRTALLRPLHLHQPGAYSVSEIPLESDLFEGKMILLLSGLPDSPSDFFRCLPSALLLGADYRPSIAAIYTTH
jgi:hypothetical protein